VALAVTPASAADHVVRDGENLTSIARRYGVTTADLVRLNGISDPNHVLVGARLQLPSRSRQPSTARTTTQGRTAPIPSGVEKVPIFSISVDQQRQVARAIERAAVEFAVSPSLLKALLYTESRWRQEAVSATGALGIGQLLPDTAAWLATLMGEPDLDPADRTDNLRMSAYLLGWLLDHTRSTSAALASYYQGIGSVLRRGVSPAGAGYAKLVVDRRAWFR
jgi:soluble lytic murein transglycosylase-like protein